MLALYMVWEVLIIIDVFESDHQEKRFQIKLKTVSCKIFLFHIQGKINSKFAILLSGWDS